MKEGHAGSARLALQMQRRELRLRHKEQRLKRQDLQLRQREKRVISQLGRAKQSEHGFGGIEPSSEAESVAELETSSDLGKRLISKGFGPPDENINMGLALVWAATNNYEEEVQLLVQQGADVNFVRKVDRFKHTALYCASSLGFCPIITILASAGADLEWKTNEGTTALLSAAWYGHLEAIRLLIHLGASPTCQDREDDGLLHMAAIRGHSGIVSLLCSSDLNVNSLNKNRQTPAHISCIEGHLDILETLVSYHANIAAKDARNRTPLHEAAHNGRSEMMKYLLQGGADPTAADLSGNTPLHDAARFGKKAPIQILLRYNVDVNVQNNQSGRLSPLMVAALAGRTDVMRLLIEHGADDRATNDFEYTLLHLATITNHTEMIRFLIEDEANIEARGDRGETPLIIAAKQGWMDSVRVLVGYKADLNIRDFKGATPLHYAVKNEDKVLIHYLIQKGADMEIGNSDGMTVLIQAAGLGHRDILSLFLNNDANVSAKDKYGRTALHLTAQKGLDTLVELLLDKGADPTAETTAGKRPEDLALGNGHSFTATLLANSKLVSRKGIEQSKSLVVSNLVATAANGTISQLVRILDENEAIINNLDLNGRSAISTAAENGYHAVVEFLLKRGNLVDARDTHGETALWWASRNGHLQVVKKLLEFGACTEMGDSDNQTPLCAAAQKGHDLVVSALLKVGGNVNTATTYGKTPLMLAANAGNLQMLQLLLNNGAEVGYSHRGTTALSLAEAAGHKEVADILQSHNGIDEKADAQLSSALAEAADAPLSGALVEAAVLGQAAEVLRLIKAGVDLSVKTERHWRDMPLFLAIKEGHTKVVEVLINKSGTVDMADKDNVTALSWAAKFGQLDIIRILCRHGADIDHMDNQGRTAISYAAELGQEKAARLLMDLGAYVEVHDKESRTPLFFAAKECHMEIVDALLEKKANTEFPDALGRPPLIMAVMAGDWSLCDLFLRKGAQMSVDSRQRGSPLSWAAVGGHESIVELLIEHGADLNHLAAEHRTPLILAAIGGHPMVVKILVEMGANIDSRDIYNRTAMSYAKELNHELVVKLLSQDGKLRAKNERALRRRGRDNVRKRMQYEYAPLPKGFIRILELFPGKTGEIISFDLYQVELKNENTRFDALSYEWKGKVGTVPVQCNQDRLLITPNCKAALEVLRKENDTRMLWIDAICINQDDEEERSTQVAMMTSIYETANTVLMWLGQKEKYSELAFSNVLTLAQAWEESQKDEHSLEREILQKATITMQNKLLVLKGWEELVKRSYFKRAWIFQEVILAGSRGLVMCGNLSSPWDSFNAALQACFALTNCYNDSFKILTINADGFKKHGYMPFTVAVLNMSFLNCGDARDKVFATLGIVEPGTSPEADYTKSVQDVFLEANCYIIAYNRGVLWTISHGTKTDRQSCDMEAIEGLPSWAYDFTQPYTSIVPNIGTKSFANFLVGSPTITGMALNVYGCVLDKIVLAVTITKIQETFEIVKPVVQAMAKQRRGIYDLYPAVGKTNDAQGNTQSPKKTNGDALLTAMFRGDIPTKDKLYLGSYLAWMILHDDDIPGDDISNSPPTYLETRIAGWNAESQKSNTFNLNVCRIMERKHRSGWDLVYTEKGYLGLIERPRPCEDMVVALIGDSPNLIMLKKHTQGPDEWYEKAGAIFLYGWNEQTIKTNELKDIDDNAEVVRLEIR
ncbi:hypothetical protein PG990_008810 [Apiospora arundinis]